jgi:predicted outer membrane repeat protein
LRQALLNASNGDMIEFAPGVSGAIVLESTLEITTSVTINGPGQHVLTLDGGSQYRVVYIYEGLTVTITGLTIANGRASEGGGFTNTGGGGGILNSGLSLTVSECSFINNVAAETGGAISNDHDPSLIGAPTFIATKCSFSDNSAPGGGAIYSGATAIIAECSFTGNSSQDVGGAIVIFGPLHIESSFFADNTATFGGAVYNVSAPTFSVANSTFSKNIAEAGGAIYNTYFLPGCENDIFNCTFDNNASSAIFNHTDFASLLQTVANSTFSGNSGSEQSGDAGGISNYVDNSHGSQHIRLLNCTFNGNSGVSAGAVLTLCPPGSTAIVEMGNTIFAAGSQGANLANMGLPTDVSLISLGYNLSSDDDSAFLNQPTDQNSTNPLLGPLQDNGGPTFTHALLPLSPAIDKGKNVTSSTTDQRGFARTVDNPAIANGSGGDGTDIGAVEFECSAPQVAITAINGPVSGLIFPVNASVTLTGSFVSDDGPHTAIWTIDGTDWPGTVDESGTVADTFPFDAPGVYSVVLTVLNSCGNSASADSVGGQSGLVVIYDPSAGFVTGGGWITSPAGAYVPDASLIGKANFGFVSKYKKGAATPTGETTFQFKMAGLNFSSESYQWLVVSGARAQYKGSGSVNGMSGYGFILTAIDGQLQGGGGTDKFRIKIWNSATSVIVYDNQMSADDSATPLAIGGGSIVIHK